MPRRPFTPREFGGALVVVVAAYEPEAKGYLRLRCGDRLKLLCAECVKGSNDNSFSEYAYGRRVRERDTQKLVDRDTQGWFPFTLVHSVFRSTPSVCGMWSLELCLPQSKGATGLCHLSSSLQLIRSAIAPRLILRVPIVCDPSCELQR